jgi:hypothetical protein
VARWLFPKEDHDARDERQNGNEYAGRAKAYAEDANETDKDEINGQQEHADVFSDHENDPERIDLIVTRKGNVITL